AKPRPMSSALSSSIRKTKLTCRSPVAPALCAMPPRRTCSGERPTSFGGRVHRFRRMPDTDRASDGGPARGAVAAFEFAKAKLTGEEPKLGENRKVTVEM